MKPHILNRAVEEGRDAAFTHEDRLAARYRAGLAQAGRIAARRFADRAGASLTAAAPSKQAAMVAVYPSPEQQASLAQPNGEPAEIIHCTLAFLGELDPDQAEAAATVVAEVARTFEPRALAGTVGGIAAFGSETGKWAEIARVAALVAPDGGYGETLWHFDEEAVYWVPADWTSEDEAASAVQAFFAIPGVESVVVLESEAATPDSDAFLLLWANGEAKVEASYPSILLPDVPGLAELRQAVVEALRENGIFYAETHGWTPHLTVDYVTEPEPPPSDLLGLPLTFDALSFTQGDVARDFPFGEDILVAAGPPPWHPPHPDEILDVDEVIGRLRTKADPVRRAAIKAAALPALDAARLDWDVTNPFVASVLDKTASEVVNIAETTRLNVLRIIRDGYEQGLTIPDTAKAIREGMTAAADARATAIARTEMTSLVSGGSLAATSIVAEATGSEFVKTWRVAPGAEHPRHEDYDDLDGQTVGLDDLFDVGDARLAYPADPDGPPEETVNCRCVLTYAEKADIETEADPPDLAETADELAQTESAPITGDDVESLAASVVARATAIEPKLTEIMRAVVEPRGGVLEGLGFRLKSEKSMARKIKLVAKQAGIPEKAAAHAMKDGNRYTAVFGPADFATKTRSTLESLRRAGIEPEIVNARWASGQPYVGTNVVMRAPNGIRFELQFHTPESLRTKQVINHPLYEHWRQLEPGSVEAREVEAQMARNADRVMRPKGILGWSYEPSVEADVGITPFRAATDDPIGFYDSDRFKSFQQDVDAAAKQYGVDVRTQARVGGVWEGSEEPAVALRVHDGELGVRAFAADLGKAYDQDGVLLFTAKQGEDVIATFGKPLSAEKITKRSATREIRDLESRGLINVSPNGRVVGGKSPEYTQIGLALDRGDRTTTLVLRDSEGKVGAAINFNVEKDQVFAIHLGSVISDGGTRLVAEAAKVADEKGLPLVLETTQEARDFYLRLGFREVEADFPELILDGDALKALIEKTGTQQVFAAMSDVGLPAGRLLEDGRLQVIGSGPEFVAKLDALAARLRTGYDADVGEFRLLEKGNGDYEAAIRDFGSAPGEQVRASERAARGDRGPAAVEARAASREVLPAQVDAPPPAPDVAKAATLPQPAVPPVPEPLTQAELKRLSVDGLWDLAAELGRIENIARAEVADAAQAPLYEALWQRGEGRLRKDLLHYRDIAGDQQVHSVYSDGHMQISEMVEEARARGQKQLVISDHSHLLSAADIEAQHKQIDVLNALYDDFRVLKGIEANILADGTLDTADAILSKFDVVNAAIHAPQQALGGQQVLFAESNTARLLKAMDNPNVTVLVHPHSVDANWPRIAEKAAEKGIALEVNGRDMLRNGRQAEAAKMIAAAKDAGAKLAIGSDAHTSSDLVDALYAVRFAAQHGVTPEDIYAGQSARAALDPTSTLPASVSLADRSLNELGGGMNEVYTVERNGQKYVVKPTPNAEFMIENAGFDPEVDLLRENVTPGFDIERERAAYVLSEHFNRLGGDRYHVYVPAYRVGEFIEGLEVGQVRKAGIAEFVEGDTAVQMSADWQKWSGLTDGELRSSALFDAIIGNTDRHGGNFILQAHLPKGEGHLWLIDHGLSFPGYSDATQFQNQMLVDLAASRLKKNLTPNDRDFLERFLADWDQIKADLLKTGLDSDDVGAVRDRVEYMLEENSRRPWPHGSDVFEPDVSDIGPDSPRSGY